MDNRAAELRSIPIRQWYNKKRSFMPGTLFVVATPIGNLEDITLRALRVLREVAVIAAEDTRRTAHLLSRHAIATPTTSLHEHNEHRRTRAIVERLQRGEDVALVSDAGTPTVSDPGAELIGAAIEAGIRVEAVPGPSAILAALAASGLPSQPFTFLGFPPTRSKDRSAWFAKVRQAGDTVVFFEAPHRIMSTLAELMDSVGDCQVCVGRELTKAHEQLVIGPISAVLSKLETIKGEFTVVAYIGQVPDNNDHGEVPVSASRRQAMASLAKAHGLTANQLYQAIEAVKKSVE
jgi:16S rRNA (cytidine1402-2'-O)-methyltransferase